VGIIFGVAAIFLTSYYYGKKELNRVVTERRVIEVAAAANDEEANIKHAVSAEQVEEDALERGISSAAPIP
jgi:hypothetical protein